MASSSYHLKGKTSLSFAQKLSIHLTECEKDCDVTFLVGPGKEPIRALRIILVVTSPVFKQLFEEKWDLEASKSVISDKDVGSEGTVTVKQGIPLPDVDPEAFKIFLKLLLWDDISSDRLLALDLSTKNLFNLLGLCETYGLVDLYNTVGILVETFFSNLPTFIRSDEFIRIPKNVLGRILQEEFVTPNEITVFESVLKWAEFQCAEKGIESSGGNTREMLGDCLKLIRFPIMSMEDFGNLVCPTNILTDEEKLKLFQYIVLTDQRKKSVDVSLLGFNASQRLSYERVIAESPTELQEPRSANKSSSLNDKRKWSKYFNKEYAGGGAYDSAASPLFHFPGSPSSASKKSKHSVTLPWIQSSELGLPLSGYPDNSFIPAASSVASSPQAYFSLDNNGVQLFGQGQKESDRTDNSDCETLSMLSQNLIIADDLRVSAFHPHSFLTDKKISLYSIGFLGPILSDATYDVKISVNGLTDFPLMSRYCVKEFRAKKVSAKQRQVFHVPFDVPVDLEANTVYEITHELKGKATQSFDIDRKNSDKIKVTAGGVLFACEWGKQIAELRFRKFYKN